MANGRKLWKSVRFYQILFVLLTILLIALLFFKRAILDNNTESFTRVAQYKSREQADDSHSIDSNIACNSTTNVSLPVYVCRSYEFNDKFPFEEHAPGQTRLTFNFYKNAPVKDFIQTFKGHKVVHLDLKGAPPKVTYFAWLFPFIRKLGGTGILIEYEDMFPYKTFDVAAKNAYTKEDIAYIIRLANESSLDLIPLIQTLGHLEFVLKLEHFMELREVRRYPQSICPSKNKSLEVIKSMIDEVMELHKGSIRYLHIGCDEVFQLAECNDCRRNLYQNKWKPFDLYLNHVTTLARYIRIKYPGVTPLIWDDQLRPMSYSDLINWNIGELVEPVVWKYASNVEAQLPGEIWDKYGKVFPAVWFASAFKGAQEPDTIIPPLGYYFENHKSWMCVYSAYSSKVNFKGAVLTGWQRFDHFSVLCELLPVAIPSLAINLLYLSTDANTLLEVSQLAQAHCLCPENPVYSLSYSGKHCLYPGGVLQQAVTRLAQLVYKIGLAKGQSEYKGWFTSYNIDNLYSNPSHVEECGKEFLNLFMEMLEIQNQIETSMENVYTNDTIIEWLTVNLKPHKDQLRDLIQARDRLLAIEHWPKRPIELKSTSDIEDEYSWDYK